MGVGKLIEVSPGGLLLLAERFEWLGARGPPGITGNGTSGSPTPGREARGVPSQGELLPAALALSVMPALIN